MILKQDLEENLLFILPEKQKGGKKNIAIKVSTQNVTFVKVLINICLTPAVCAHQMPQATDLQIFFASR